MLEDFDALARAERALNILTVQNNGRDDCVYLMSGRRNSNGNPEFLTDAYEFTPRKYNESLFDSSIGSYDADKGWVVLGENSRCSYLCDGWRGFCDGSGSCFYLRRSRWFLVATADSLKLKHPGFPKRTWAYHTITQTWVDAGPSPLNQVTTIAVPWGDEIIIPSGEIKPRVRTTQISAVSLKPSSASFGMVNYLTVIITLVRWLESVSMLPERIRRRKISSEVDRKFPGGLRVVAFLRRCYHRSLLWLCPQLLSKLIGQCG